MLVLHNGLDDARWNSLLDQRLGLSDSGHVGTIFSLLRVLVLPARKPAMAAIERALRGGFRNPRNPSQRQRQRNTTELQATTEAAHSVQTKQKRRGIDEEKSGIDGSLQDSEYEAENCADNVQLVYNRNGLRRVELLWAFFGKQSIP